MNKNTNAPSPSEGLMCHSSEGQRRIQVVLNNEGSPPPWPRNQWGRPPTQTTLRAPPRDLSGADGLLSTPGSDLEHCAHLAASKVEDQEPPKQSPKVRKAGLVHVCRWGRGEGWATQGGVPRGYRWDQSKKWPQTTCLEEFSHRTHRVGACWVGAVWKALGRFLSLKRHMEKESGG